MHALPPNLLENLLKCQKSATQAIQRLDLMVNSPMISSALSGEKKKEATRVLNLYGPDNLNLPEKAKAWADYFKARHEHARVEMENWGVSSTAALPSAERTPAGTTKKAVSYGDTISNVKTDHVPPYGGKRKTRKRKRKRRTRKRRKKKKTKRKHKKRHRRTRRR